MTNQQQARPTPTLEPGLQLALLQTELRRRIRTLEVDWRSDLPAEIAHGEGQRFAYCEVLEMLESLGERVTQ